MLNAKETINTTIVQLSLLNATGSDSRPASFDDLVALNTARECIDELFRDCIDELSVDPKTAALWSAIASASKLSSKPASGTQKSYGLQAADSRADSRADKRVGLFWRTFAPVFAWDFLPIDFLHELYTQWLSTEFPRDVAFSRETFPRRLKAALAAPGNAASDNAASDNAAPANNTSGEWLHVRSRPGSLMDAAEPLVELLPNWTPISSDRALYGLRRGATV